MKTHFTILLFLLSAKILCAQDTTQVFYSEVHDTLMKQRFIDRYENVFMTKVPTRHMFKVGVTFNSNFIYSSNTVGHYDPIFNLGYEYKLSPSWSIGTDLYGNGSWGGYNGFRGTFVGNVYGRWYYDMKKRIMDGNSVSNFTGNYIAPVVEYRWGTGFPNYRFIKMGGEFGLQRRFLNNKRMELAIGGFYEDVLKIENINFTYPNTLSHFHISTRVALGFAFGDWKKNKRTAACEVLLCDQFLQQRWKLQWPQIYLSPRFINGNFAISFERKLGRGPFSVNTQLNLHYLRIYDQDPLKEIASNDFRINPIIQLRYYLAQKRNIRKGTGGNNLNGLYVTPYTDFVHYRSESYYALGEVKKHWGAGLGIGYQQIFFQKAYLDFSFGLSRNFINMEPTPTKALKTGQIAFGIAF